MVMFPVLFLQVMAPLNEVHRIIDEGHECSLKVADLLDLLDEPVDRSFRPVEVREPVIDGSVPLFVAEGLRVDYRTGRRPAQAGARRRQPDDPRRARPSAWPADRAAASPPGSR